MFITTKAQSGTQMVTFYKTAFLSNLSLIGCNGGLLSGMAQACIMSYSQENINLLFCPPSQITGQ